MDRESDSRRRDNCWRGGKFRMVSDDQICVFRLVLGDELVATLRASVQGHGSPTLGATAPIARHTVEFAKELRNVEG